LSSPLPSVAGLARRTWIVLAVVLGLVWFANLDVRKLQHPDEGRYAEIAREMVATGDFVTPRLNGLRYFEKPPLQYWLTAASFEAFELDEWTARLPSALAGFATLATIAYVGWRLASPAAGLYGAAALAGCVWMFGISHMVTLDALLTCFLTLALGGFLLAQRAPDRAAARRPMLVAYAALAGAMLTKGLVALLIPFATLVAYSLATRDRSPWRRLHLVRGLALFVVLAAPWFVLVSLRNPEFARFFFVHEHFERFLTTEHRRTGAWWYFVPMFLAGFLPWTGVFLWRLPSAWRHAEPTPAGFSWPRFCLVWCGFVFAFFSASGSKLPSYILPMFPPAALVLGAELARLSPRALLPFVGLLVGSTLALFVVVVLAWPWIAAALADARTPRALFDALGPWTKLSVGVALAGYGAGLAVLLGHGERHRSVGIVVLALATLVAMQAAFTGSDVFRATRSAADLVTALENEANPPYDPTAPFFQVRMYDQTLPFYLERTTTLVEYRDELGPGLDAEPGRGIAHLADWVDQWRALAQGYALLDPPLSARLAAQGVPMRVVAQSPRYVVVARR
jgi:4-amino-4-deoxy-L-arabinose transferase-like glycosyltransferase